ncbi:MAG: MurR/RpiR family transcriptional regulator [Erysipelotrichaceae bacterium]|nr:MurR/RpiR family transcriptional regulator [Erysipelotrichaceae bacterium]MDY5252817.1 MurR/RpiR family transcriptional regulator [Erysipelotrichaceae bacterium]
MLSLEQLRSLNKKEALVYDYILENSESIDKMKIKDLAKATNVSIATILRLCKKADCEGFLSFKAKFQQYLIEQEKLAKRSDIPMLITALKKFDDDEFYHKIEKIALLINQCNNIITIGRGTSGIVASYAARYFTGIGKSSYCIDDPFYPLPPAISNNDIVLAFSESGEVLETINHVQEMQQQGCYIIAITNRHECPLVDLADESLHYYIPSRIGVNTYNLTSQVPVIVLIEMLANKYKDLTMKEHNPD